MNPQEEKLVKKLAAFRETLKSQSKIIESIKKEIERLDSKRIQLQLEYNSRQQWIDQNSSNVTKLEEELKELKRKEHESK